MRFRICDMKLVAPESSSGGSLFQLVDLTEENMVL